MSSESYIAKLKSPLWQRKRSGILQRDNWTCVKCGYKHKTLHVHHKTYLKVHNPWDYEDSFLETLCEDCHRKEHFPDRVEYTPKYNHLIEYKKVNPVFEEIISEIEILQNNLLNPLTDEAMTETLTKIVELQNKKKGVSKYA